MVFRDEIVKSIEASLHYAKVCNYASLDISDLYQTKYYEIARSLPGVIGKAAMVPYSLLMDWKPELLRSLVQGRPKIYPQGLAMIIRGLVNLHQKKHSLGDISQAISLGDWLIDNRSVLSHHSGWGQPFDWRSRNLVFPKNLPRATVTSQVMHALMDLYDVTNDQRYLEVSIDAAHLFLREFNYTADSKGNHCISYTTLDHYHIHNASMLAAGAVMRVTAYVANDELREFALKAALFTASHQNNDGSFYYWAPPDNLNYMIDNYHTGFVLEGFWNIIQFGKVYELQGVFAKGMEYYRNELFDDVVPKFTKDNMYPIDIQSCAQSIISFALDPANHDHVSHAKQVAEFTLDKMYMHANSHFAYKLFEGGTLDSSYYIRWGDAWMIRALTMLI